MPFGTVYGRMRLDSSMASVYQQHTKAANGWQKFRDRHPRSNGVHTMRSLLPGIWLRTRPPRTCVFTHVLRAGPSWQNVSAADSYHRNSEVK